MRHAYSETQGQMVGVMFFVTRQERLIRTAFSAGGFNLPRKSVSANNNTQAPKIKWRRKAESA